MGGNYEKSLYKQLETALLKIDELSDKVKKIEAETENRYIKIIYELKAENVLLCEENASLKEKVAKCEAEIDRLRKQLNNNSTNSSTPPSSDVKANRPNTFNSRTKTSKTSGGQKNHKGYHLNKTQIE